MGLYFIYKFKYSMINEHSWESNIADKSSIWFSYTGISAARSPRKEFVCEFAPNFIHDFII